jgi:hypothetical protein
MTGTWSLSKQAAGYKPAPRPEVRCDACEFMFPRLARGSCKYVRGIIAADYTCNEFSARSKPTGNGPTSPAS